MLSAAEIKSVKFAKSISGYKQEEVDILLDKIEADYVQFERMLKEYQLKITACEDEIKELKSSQGSIQTVLLSAQNLADNIVKEAKEKSEEIIHNAEKNIIAITEKEKDLSSSFELKAQERKEALEKDLSEMIKQAQLKAESITNAANDSVARQQMLFDKLKLEIAAFKSSITAKYKEHLEIFNHIPDSVPSDPQYLAKLLTDEFNKEPEPEIFISKPLNTPEPEVENTSVQEDSSEGFKVEDING